MKHETTHRFLLKSLDVPLTVLGARPDPRVGTTGATGGSRIWQSVSPQVHLYIWRSTQGTADSRPGKRYLLFLTDLFFSCHTCHFKGLVLTVTLLLKVWRSASPLQEGSSISWRQERRIYADALTLCWTRPTECWTWVLNRRFGKLLTKSE